MTEAVSEHWQPTRAYEINLETGEFEGALGDLWNSRQLVARHGDDLRHDHDSKTWLAWNGQRWRRDDTGEVVRRAKATVVDLHRESLRGTKTDRDLVKHASRSQSRNAISAMVDLARSEAGIPVIGDELDADPWLLNVANGTIDLRTGTLREHRREDLCTKLAPVEFDPAAVCPVWDTFMSRIFNGNAETIGYLQRALGYSLTGRVEEHVLHACWGTGANGKSTLLNAYAALLGDYSQVLASDTLLRRKAGSASNDVAGLKGVRFALVAETPEGARLNEVLVKGLTGGDKVRARALYQDFIEFQPVAKYWIATNRKPVVPADDEGLWRRLRLVPFTVTISEEERDANLPDKLLAELPGILAWAVRGCLAWQAQGLGSAESVKTATAAYRTEMDGVAAFIDDSCQVGEREMVGATALFGAYKAWAETTGERPISQKAFGAELTRLGFEKGRGHGGGFRYRGLALREDEGERVNHPSPGEPSKANWYKPLGNEMVVEKLVDQGAMVHPQIQEGRINHSPGSQTAVLPHPPMVVTDLTATPCPGCSRPSVGGRPCFKCQEAA